MKKRIMALALAAVAVIGMTGCGGTDTEKNTNTTNVDNTTIVQAQMPEDGEEIAVITTSKGVVKMRFFPEEAPKAVENFKTLAKDGYYDGLTFHRVINEFMVQTGDPTATGTGGESCWGEDFETEVSERLHFYRGAVAMANAGPDTNGSQFFIVQQKSVMEDALRVLTEARDNNEEEIGVTLTDGNYYTLSQLYPDEVLDHYKAQGGSVHLEYIFGGAYSIFGQVFEGLEAIDEIAAVETDENDKPLNDVIIENVTFENYKAQ